MSGRFYMPFTYVISGAPVIVYPVRDENDLGAVFRPLSEASIVRHLQELYAAHGASFGNRTYDIVFVWSDGQNRMTDWWCHDGRADTDSGPISTCHTFQGLEECSQNGHASNDTLIVLGREAELWDKMEAMLRSISYPYRPQLMPAFPDRLAPTEPLPSGY